MTDYAEMIERLRFGLSRGDINFGWQKDCLDAADAIEKLVADLAAARAALRTAESPSSEWSRRHAPAIAAARAEKEKTDD